MNGLLDLSFGSHILKISLQEYHVDLQYSTNSNVELLWSLATS